jgi:hypothetical protein
VLIKGSAVRALFREDFPTKNFYILSIQGFCFNTRRMIDDALLESSPDIYRVQTKAAGPAGSLPFTDEMLRERPSGDLFGLSQNAGMGWDPTELGRKQVLILSTQGGLRAPDGKPIALGYHTGHWEIGLLVQAAAEELRRLKIILLLAIALIRATGARRARSECSTVCLLGMTRRRYFAGWLAPCQPGLG